MITKLPRVIPIVSLHEEKGMPLIRSHYKRLARKSATSENSRIQELGHYDTVGDKHLRPHSLLAW
jgi:hypothetical protein